MAAPKKKKLTQREVALRAQVKKELQAKGVLPPDKPKLNRKKFAQEVFTEFEEMEVFRANYFLRKAIGCMVAPKMFEVTSEEVGVLKLLKLAVEMSKFSEAIEAEGRTEYTIGELADKVVTPILKL